MHIHAKGTSLYYSMSCTYKIFITNNCNEKSSLPNALHNLKQRFWEDVSLKTEADEPKHQNSRQRSAHSAKLLLDSIIPYQINRLSHRMNKLLDQELRAHGLSMSIWRIMAVLDFNSTVTVNELARYAMIEQSTLSRMIQRMEAAGLLVSQKSSEDGRVRSITLTTEGYRQFDMVQVVTMKHTGRIVAGFSRVERAQLMSLIARMQENIEALNVEDGIKTGGTKVR